MNDIPPIKSGKPQGGRHWKRENAVI